MKMHLHINRIFPLALLTTLAGSLWAQGQQNYAGDWTGMFMEDFKTVIQLKWDEEKGFSGFIMMYDGSSQIQDDELTEIAVVEKTLTFRIRAKETDFEGTFNQEITELSGKFTFPDGTRHPLEARKYF